MEKGNKVIELQGPIRVVIVTDGPFTVYGMDGKKKSSILGPVMVDQRWFSFVLNPPLTGFMIQAKQTVSWDLSFLDATDGKEYNDNIPVELPIGYEKPLTLKEDMMRFIREEVSSAADRQGVETFDDADDFNLLDEEEPLSEYEFAELQDDYVEPELPLNPPEKPPEKPSEKSPEDPLDKKVDSPAEPDSKVT